MTAGELVTVVIKTDLALSAGVVAAMALRLPVRRWVGAGAAYSLWLLPLIAAGAVLLPGRVVTVSPASMTPPTAAPTQVYVVSERAAIIPARPVRGIDPMLGLSLAWAAGVVGAAAWFARGQLRFLAAARRGAAGPAAVGVIRPRVVTPADFATRYSRAERASILAHEAAHIAAQHPRANALAAAVQALHWFNPLVHLAAHLMRIDQELACDAAVVGARPNLRRLYAQTLLKSQLSATPLPLGCYWPAKAEHPLTRRVEMLSRAPRSRWVQFIGAAGVALLTLAGGIGAWAAQPARVIVAAKSAAPRPGSINMSADRISTSTDGKTTTLTGDVVVKAGTLEARADRLVLIDHDPKPATSSRAAAAPQDDKTAALKAGDWRKAAQAGATAADIVRALQAKGREKGVDPEAAVVAIDAAGKVEVTPMKPLPALAGDNASGRTVGLGGSGFSFGAKPGTILLYPKGATSFAPAGPNGAPAGQWRATPGPQSQAPSQSSPSVLPAGWRPFAAVYDGDAPVLLKGAVTGLEWTSPRVLMHMVDAASGQRWAVEGGSPEVMARSGFTPENLQSGTAVTVRGYQAKDKRCEPECLANGRDVTFGDGTKRFVGP